MTNAIRRVALYSMCLFLVSSVSAAATSALWLIGPPAQWPLFLMIHQLALSFALGSGGLLFIALFIFHRLLVPGRDYYYSSLDGARVHVGLTAYNDEQCIGDAVREFKACSAAHKVIVVENNSKDATYRKAIEAGADEVFTEMIPGYGSCCMRALAEAAKGADVIILCEGDMTFCGSDIPKLLAYLENCDLVLGTRATQELRETQTQMDWLINPANQVMAKLIQTRFWGTRLTDVGCTYRAIRAEAYLRLSPHLHIRGNHFSPHMFIEALKLNMRVIEIPVTFRKRAGQSKGVGSNKIKAAKVAISMLKLLFRA